MKSSPLYHDYSFFQYVFLTSPSCPGRHKTEAKYIAAIKLKWEAFLFFFLVNISKYDFMSDSDNFQSNSKIVKERNYF